MSNLLVATDLTPRSDRALYRAIKLATESNFNLHVLHVVDEDLSSKIKETVKKEAPDTIKDQIKTFKSRLKIKVTIKVISGKHYDEILSEAEKIKAKAIILGTPKKRTLSDFFIGSTIERIIRYADCPVFVIKKASMKKYKKALVAIDFSVYSRRCLELALDFFPNEGIYLVHAYHIPYKTILDSSTVSRKVKNEQRMQFLKSVEKEMTHFLSPVEKNTENINIIIKEGPLITRLNNEIKNIKPDLLVMGTHGKTGLSKTLLGSVTQKMLTTTSCDIVVVPAW